MIGEIERLKYLEALAFPKFQGSLTRLFDKYESFMTYHHPQTIGALLDIIERACMEGDGILIQPEYCGYFVAIWKDSRR